MHNAEIHKQQINNSVWVVLASLAIIAGLGLAWIQGDQGGPKLDEADTIAITKANFLFQFAISSTDQYFWSFAIPLCPQIP